MPPYRNENKYIKQIILYYIFIYRRAWEEQFFRMHLCVSNNKFIAIYGGDNQLGEGGAYIAHCLSAPKKLFPLPSLLADLWPLVLPLVLPFWSLVSGLGYWICHSFSNQVGTPVALQSSQWYWSRGSQSPPCVLLAFQRPASVSLCPV